MAVKKSIICGNCKALISGSASGKCPNCKTEYTGKEVGVAVVTELSMKSRRPEPGEIAKLAGMPFTRKPLSAGERNKGLMNIVLGIVVPVLLVLFGLFVINNFKGLGAIVFGYGPFIVAPIFAYLFIVPWGIVMLVRDPRKKTVKKAFRWIWKESYMDAFADDNERNHKYAHGAVVRTVPDAISDGVTQEILKEYLSTTRELLKAALDESSRDVDTSCIWKDGSAVSGEWRAKYAIDEISIRVTSEQEAGGGASEVTGEFVFNKTLSFDTANSNQDVYELDVASVAVKVHGHYIKNGVYWFPYDLMPVIAE